MPRPLNRCILVPLLMLSAIHSWAAPLATETVKSTSDSTRYSADGVVEAVRSSSIGADLSGRVTSLPIKAGDQIRAGQVLVRIDERVAAQQAVASQSQVAAARAQLATAQADFERRQKLYEQKFLSKAALDRAEAEFKSATAQTKAQIAQANAANVQTGLHTLAAPYSGVVAETYIELGDMVTPGKPLLAFYDPTALRVTVNLPQSQIPILLDAQVAVEVPGAQPSSFLIAPGDVVVLPTADPASHTVQVRIALPATAKNMRPGMFARAQLPIKAAADSISITIPAAAVITRSEVTAVYVVDKAGKASLRQIRPGRRQGDRIEVLAGLNAGEKIALDPLAAARQR